MPSGSDESIAPSGAPPGALRIWATGTDCYVEIPGRAGPYIQRLAYDHRAIAHIFSLLGLHRVDYEYLGTIPEGYKKPIKAHGTATQQDTAEAILRRMGILK